MFRRFSPILSTFLRSSKHRVERTNPGESESAKSSGKLVLDRPPHSFKVELHPTPLKPGTEKQKTFITVSVEKLSSLWPSFGGSKPTVRNSPVSDGHHDSETSRPTLPTAATAKKMEFNTFKPPETVRGLKTLDRSLFNTTVQIPGIKVPAKTLHVVMKQMRKDTLKIHGVRAIAQLDEGDELFKTHKLILLDPKKHPDASTFSETLMETFKENDVDLSSFSKFDIELGYKNWPADEILRAVLPEDQESVSGFTQIGHIVHLNLKSHLSDYKNVIGEVLLDKVPTGRTVVNKVDTIDNTFRNFNLEVLAGENVLITTAKENGCSFEMDFSKVYWNSRLSTEHQRIVDQLERNDIVYDVFAGIGPFSIPAAKKKCVVFANDLNPESFKWLQHNVKKNKITSNITTYNSDGRDFIRGAFKEDFVKRLSTERDSESCEIHVVMNLPALAVEFLDAFSGLLEESDCTNFIEPLVHCYCFSKEEDYTKDVRERAEKSLGASLPDGHVIRFVRHVAPNKDMLCVEFRLQKDVLVGKTETEEPESKRAKLL